MIYLDNMGHLFSDESLQELFDFAMDILNFRADWNHYTEYYPHFDILMRSKKQGLDTLLMMGLYLRQELMPGKPTM